MFKRTMRRPLAYSALVAVLVLFTLTGIGLATRGAATAGAPAETTLTLEVPRRARPGELIRVKLVATGAADLAGFQGTVRFDPTQLRLTGAAIEKGLSKGGRDILPLGPVLRRDSVVLGAATCPVAACGDSRPARAVRQPRGVNGRVELATIEFYTETAGQYELRLEGVSLVNPQGTLLPSRAAGSVLRVSAR